MNKTHHKQVGTSCQRGLHDICTWRMCDCECKHTVAGRKKLAAKLAKEAKENGKV